MELRLLRLDTLGMEILGHGTGTWDLSAAGGSGWILFFVTN